MKHSFFSLLCPQWSRTEFNTSILRLNDAKDEISISNWWSVLSNPNQNSRCFIWKFLLRNACQTAVQNRNNKNIEHSKWERLLLDLEGSDHDFAPFANLKARLEIINPPPIPVKQSKYLEAPILELNTSVKARAITAPRLNKILNQKITEAINVL